MSESSSGSRKQGPKRPRHRNHPLHPPSVTPNVTGPLDILNGRKVVAVLDQLGLSEDARGRSLQIRLRDLASRIVQASRECELLTFTQIDEDDENEVREHFAKEGWGTLFVGRDFVPLVRGMPVLPQSEAMFVGLAAALAAVKRPEVFVLGTTKAELVLAFSHAVKAAGIECRIATLALAATSASWLTPLMTDAVDANIMIGEDCLEKVPEQPPFEDFEDH